ncbi:integrase arm-type DNA-binding domain-containing protein [Methylovulum psychrotolerans]|uniref:tyrosine-type recombinase/integrase n=1 Tax=Methylovulum psychrotolerans TaxID=1704499 RepID=UPI001BFF3962|nr:integrase arm-type DNA-binding domain-containing protein [Methylovulum psychrotolerans]MBT9097707.1 integrase arm-type DNA-binding domain-containing protein [Methylovulum psychrotolerans]
MPLSDPACKNAKPKDKAYKLADEKGMFLLINPNGSKYFRLKYRFNGKEKTLALGVYPETSLKTAREDRDKARQQIIDGIDPNENKKAVKQSKAESAANSFEVIAREWYERNMGDKSTDHKKRVTGLFERDLFPYIGNKPITDLKAPELLAALRRIEARNAIETAHRALQVCGQVFRYAIATGRTERDITPDLRGSLMTIKGGHFSAVTEPKQAAELLRAIDGYSGSFVVKSALQLAPLVFVRPGELRQAEWEHIDFETKEWRYLVTKTQTPHIVPLSAQALTILQELKPLTGNGRYVFPSARTPNGSRPMSDMALLAALRRMGIGKDEMTVHGFRALARTVLDEVLGFRPDFIEHQLAHAIKDPNGRAYNRTAHLAERRKMMQSWADYLDGLKNGAQVIAFKKAG